MHARGFGQRKQKVACSVYKPFSFNIQRYMTAMERQLGPNTMIFIEGGMIKGVELMNHASLSTQGMTNVERSLLDSLASNRKWDAPLEKEVAGDAARILDRKKTTPLTILEHEVMDSILRLSLARNARSLSRLLEQVAGKNGVETAVQTMADVDTFKCIQKEFGTGVSDGESGSYWMEELVGRDVEALYQKRQVIICDFGAATGSRAYRMKQELEPKALAHATDLGYGPHHPLDMVYRTTMEAMPRSMKDSVDISMTSYSLRYSPFPHIAVRNMLNATRHAAYLTLEDYSGVLTALHVLPKPTRDLYYRYMGGRQEPVSLNAIKPSLNAKVRNELLQAEHRGFTITVADKGQDGGEKFIPLGQMPEDMQIQKIIATRK